MHEQIQIRISTVEVERNFCQCPGFIYGRHFQLKNNKAIAIDISTFRI